MRGLPGRRAGVDAGIAVAGTAVAVWCLVRAVTVVGTTGGLLVTPVPHSVWNGGWLTGGVAAATVAALALIDLAALLVSRDGTG